ncbi:hypothetical protein FC83_GL000003 [Agrilactobacillus composti DSM 18527 = JCM 14202]|uniref:DUF4097 domain-containing protein n=1 Tax=Agrilactobacillus composti DSM 18527 = JCM 14202 TaxID=1423734 RepID=X0PHT8_9LACO|nr:DUF4097 family beta strand repeat-containing protein [Agrilactobacillus composti]KRM36105.1 hypothetical protein FC83_GL000003 [Agrilactobacillus composti DSM 18527 = JCM 14202]GAF41729.1 hypothetical protein JCM14202_3685 [Agrilactobacillus composti DSM 18527 = JCM 14202]
MKNLIKVGAMLFGAGLIIFAVGFLGHGFQSINIVNGRPQITQVEKRSLHPAKFNKMDVNVSYQDVVVKQGNDYEVNVTTMGDDDITSKVVDGVLQIHQSNTTSPFTFGIGSLPADKLEITVPRTAKFSDVTIHSNNGDLTYTSGTVDNLKLSSRSGNLQVTQTQVTKMTNLTTGAGDIRLVNSELNNAKLQTQSGDIRGEGGQLAQGTLNSANGNLTLQGMRFKGATTLNTSSGDNRIENAPKDAGYRLTTDSGDNKLFNRKSTEKQVIVNWDAETRLDLRTSNGDNHVE